MSRKPPEDRVFIPDTRIREVDEALRFVRQELNQIKQMVAGPIKKEGPITGANLEGTIRVYETAKGDIGLRITGPTGNFISDPRGTQGFVPEVQAFEYASRLPMGQNMILRVEPVPDYSDEQVAFSIQCQTNGPNHTVYWKVYTANGEDITILETHALTNQGKLQTLDNESSFVIRVDRPMLDGVAKMITIFAVDNVNGFRSSDYTYNIVAPSYGFSAKADLPPGLVWASDFREWKHGYFYELVGQTKMRVGNNINDTVKGMRGDATGITIPTTHFDGDFTVVAVCQRPTGATGGFTPIRIEFSGTDYMELKTGISGTPGGGGMIDSQAFFPTTNSYIWHYWDENMRGACDPLVADAPTMIGMSVKRSSATSFGVVKDFVFQESLWLGGVLIPSGSTTGAPTPLGACATVQVCGDTDEPSTTGWVNWLFVFNRSFDTMEDWLRLYHTVMGAMSDKGVNKLSTIPTSEAWVRQRADSGGLVGTLHHGYDYNVSPILNTVVLNEVHSWIMGWPEDLVAINNKGDFLWVTPYFPVPTIDPKSKGGSFIEVQIAQSYLSEGTWDVGDPVYIYGPEAIVEAEWRRREYDLTRSVRKADPEYYENTDIPSRSRRSTEYDPVAKVGYSVSGEQATVSWLYEDDGLNRIRIVGTDVDSEGNPVMVFERSDGTRYTAPLTQTQAGSGDQVSVLTENLVEHFELDGKRTLQSLAYDFWNMDEAAGADFVGQKGVCTLTNGASGVGSRAWGAYLSRDFNSDYVYNYTDHSNFNPTTTDGWLVAWAEPDAVASEHRQLIALRKDDTYILWGLTSYNGYARSVMYDSGNVERNSSLAGPQQTAPYKACFQAAWDASAKQIRAKQGNGPLVDTDFSAYTLTNQSGHVTFGQWFDGGMRNAFVLAGYWPTAEDMVWMENGGVPRSYDDLALRTVQANYTEIGSVNGRVLAPYVAGSEPPSRTWGAGTAREFDGASYELVSADTGGWVPSNDEDYWGSIWIEPDNVSITGGFIGKYNEWEVRIGASSKVEFRIKDGLTWYTATSAVVLSNGTKYNVQWWWDAATSTMYGSVNNETPVSVTRVGADSSTGEIRVGYSNSTRFDGLIKSLDLWRMTPSAEARTFIYNNGTPRRFGTYGEYVETVQTQTVNLQISQSIDDAEEDSTNAILLTRDGDPLTGLRVNYNTVGLRFRNVAIAQGTQITSATLTCTGMRPDITGAYAFNIYGEDVDNSVIFDATSGQLDARTKTTAYLAVSGSDAWSDGQQLDYDVTSVVQEILDRGGWASGNALTFIVALSSGSGRMWKPYDLSASSAAKLSIVVDAGGGGTGGGTDPGNNTADVAIQVSASAHDANVVGLDGGVSAPYARLSDTKLYLGGKWTSNDIQGDANTEPANNMVALHFPALGIPRGATIDDAFIEVISDSSSYADSFSIGIWGVMSATETPFVTGEDLWVPPRTVSNATWASTIAWTAGEKVLSPDIRTVIQEVVNHGAWSETSGLTLLLGPAVRNGQRLIRSYDYAGGVSGPRILINYTYSPPPPDTNPTDWTIAWEGDAFRTQFYDEGDPLGGMYPIFDPGNQLTRTQYVLVSATDPTAEYGPNTPGLGSQQDVIDQGIKMALDKRNEVPPGKSALDYPNTRTHTIIIDNDGYTYTLPVATMYKAPTNPPPLIISGKSPWVPAKVSMRMNLQNGFNTSALSFGSYRVLFTNLYLTDGHKIIFLSSPYIVLNCEFRNLYQDFIQNWAVTDGDKLWKAQKYMAVIGCHFHGIHNRIDSGSSYPGGQHGIYMNSSQTDPVTHAIIAHNTGTFISGYLAHLKGYPSGTYDESSYFQNPWFVNNFCWQTWRLISLDRHVHNARVRYNTHVRGDNFSTRMLAALYGLNTGSNYGLSDERMLEYSRSSGLEFVNNLGIYPGVGNSLLKYAYSKEVVGSWREPIPTTKSGNKYGVEIGTVYARANTNDGGLPGYTAESCGASYAASTFDTKWGGTRFDPDSDSIPTYANSDDDPSNDIGTLRNYLKGRAYIGTGCGAGNVERVGPLWRRTDNGY